MNKVFFLPISLCLILSRCQIEHQFHSVTWYAELHLLPNNYKTKIIWGWLESRSMLLMVLGDHVFCLSCLRHFGPHHNCYGPNGPLGSLTRCPNSRSGNLTRSHDGLNRGPDCRKGSQTQSSGSLTRGRSRPHEGCYPQSSCHRSCGRSHSELRSTRCRRYQHCQGGKLFLVEWRKPLTIYNFKKNYREYFVLQLILFPLLTYFELQFKC